MLFGRCQVIWALEWLIVQTHASPALPPRVDNFVTYLILGHVGVTAGRKCFGVAIDLPRLSWITVIITKQYTHIFTVTSFWRPMRKSQYWRNVVVK
jgi:hypothetical protein